MNDVCPAATRLATRSFGGFVCTSHEWVQAVRPRPDGQRRPALRDLPRRHAVGAHYHRDKSSTCTTQKSQNLLTTALASIQDQHPDPGRSA